jgi:hypothetical protein
VKVQNVRRGQGPTNAVELLMNERMTREQKGELFDKYWVSFYKIYLFACEMMTSFTFLLLEAGTYVVARYVPHKECSIVI